MTADELLMALGQQPAALGNPWLAAPDQMLAEAARLGRYPRPAPALVPVRSSANLVPVSSSANPVPTAPAPAPTAAPAPAPAPAAQRSRTAPQLNGMPAPVLDPVFDMATGQVNRCALGLCQDQTNTVSVDGQAMGMFGPSATGVAGAVPADTFAARMMLRSADALAGRPVAATFSGMNADLNSVGIQAMQQTPEWGAYVAQLRPIFGDAAPAVATQQMAEANGMLGTYQGSQQLPGDLAARHTAASQLQAAGLAAGDTSQALAAYGIDPGAFGNIGAFINPVTGEVQTMLGGGLADPFGVTDPFTAAPVQNPLAALQYALTGVPGYVQDLRAPGQAQLKAAPKIAEANVKQANTMAQIAARNAGNMDRQREVTRSFSTKQAMADKAAAERQAERLKAQEKLAKEKLKAKAGPGADGKAAGTAF